MQIEQCKTLTPHQRRILAALRALSHKHACPWWSRDAVGEIVGAGGFHQTIQVRTMVALKRLGLVHTEDSAWPENVRNIVRCNCACFHWGLTEKGRALAEAMMIRWSEEVELRIARAYPGLRAFARRDEGEEFEEYEDGEREELEED